MTNEEFHLLWNQWHTTTDPIERICLLVKEGEETFAIQALVGKTAPKANWQKKITSYLIQNLEVRLSKRHHISVTSPPPTLSLIVQKFHELGIYASSNG